MANLVLILLYLFFNQYHVQSNIDLVQNYITHFMANTKLSCEQVLHFYRSNSCVNGFKILLFSPMCYYLIMISLIGL